MNLTIVPPGDRPLILEPQDGVSQIRGLDVLSAMDFAHQSAGKDGLARVLSRLSEADLEVLTGGSGKHGSSLRSKNWYPFALQCRLLRALAAELGPPGPDAGNDLSVCYRAGRHQAERDLPRIFRPMLRLGRPGWIVELATRLWRNYHDEGQWQLDRSPGELIAKLIEHTDADEAFCAAFTGFVEAAFEMSGAKDVETSHPVCRARGADHCVFTIRWTV